MDELKDLEPSIVCCFGEGSSLLFAEICGNSDNSRIDLFPSEIGSRLYQTLQLTGCYLRDSDSRWVPFLLVLYCECDRAIVFFRMRRGMAVSWIY
jgi:hypothetical protein